MSFILLTYICLVDIQINAIFEHQRMGDYYRGRRLLKGCAYLIILFIGWLLAGGGRLFEGALNQGIVVH